jgi:hypothetical protein
MTEIYIPESGVNSGEVCNLAFLDFAKSKLDLIFSLLFAPSNVFDDPVQRGSSLVLLGFFYLIPEISFNLTICFSWPTLCIIGWGLTIAASFVLMSTPL